MSTQEHLTRICPYKCARTALVLALSEEVKHIGRNKRTMEEILRSTHYRKLTPVKKVCCESEVTGVYVQDKEYLCIQVPDSPDSNMLQYFAQSNDFIHRARINGGTVLIHW
ncbi:DUSP22 [Cordylochernes scorpioides]|uniref:DUSP22 n=1 Tax=Cordylochernes scorpioides TaxID=51811 RepID=A0ABY6LMX7_9ARAC|nr:DUSP22 [Cordylochernes scorpioides]